jgi:DNA replication protein DnaC
MDYSSERKLNRDMVRELSTGEWIRTGHDLILTGATGIGKSYLACALGNNACRNGMKVRYYRVTRLLTEMAIARGDGTYNKIIKDMKKIQLLILDDFGLTGFDLLAARDLLEIIEERHEERSTLFSSQLPVSLWHEIFQDSTVADAVLDRLIHGALRIELGGSSMREKRARKEVTNLPVL